MTFYIRYVSHIPQLRVVLLDLVNMSKNKTKKNSVGLAVKWPKTSYFMVEDLQNLNADVKNITLRVRLSKKIEDGSLAEIGCKLGGQGRPRKVFAFTPVTQETLDSAKSQGIVLVDTNVLQKLVMLDAPSLVSKSTPVVA